MKQKINSDPRVSIIILNWSGYEDTKECLQSLKKINYSNYEIILVDNGSGDGSPEKLKKEFTYISIIENGENMGFAEGNNIGLRQALKKTETEFVLLLNNDTVVDQDFLIQLVKVAQSNPAAGAFAPKIYYQDRPQEIWFAGGGFNKRIGQPYHYKKDLIDQKDKRMFRECEYLTGCAILTRRNVLEEVGLFDPRFFLNFEETDWCFRVRKKGYSLLYVPTSKIWHKVSRATGGEKSALNTYYFTRNQLLFLKKINRIPLLLYPKNILKILRFILFSPIRPGEAKKAISVIRGMRDFHLNRFGKRFSTKQ